MYHLSVRYNCYKLTTVLPIRPVRPLCIGPLQVSVRRTLRGPQPAAGTIAGALALPVEQLPRALQMSPEEFARTFRFARPLPLQILVMHSRGASRPASPCSQENHWMGPGETCPRGC